MRRAARFPLLLHLAGERKKTLSGLLSRSDKTNEHLLISERVSTVARVI